MEMYFFFSSYVLRIISGLSSGFSLLSLSLSLSVSLPLSFFVLFWFLSVSLSLSPPRSLGFAPPLSRCQAFSLFFFLSFLPLPLVIFITHTYINMSILRQLLSFQYETYLYTLFFCLSITLLVSTFRSSPPRCFFLCFTLRLVSTSAFCALCVIQNGSNCPVMSSYAIRFRSCAMSACVNDSGLPAQTYFMYKIVNTPQSYPLFCRGPTILTCRAAPLFNFPASISHSASLYFNCNQLAHV